MAVPYRIVIEPQEKEIYSTVLPPEKILTLPFADLGQGSIPARNWIWEHAIDAGAERHWILDDNIGCFYRLLRNRKTRIVSPVCFRAIEDFADQYENVALAGMNYDYFCPRKDLWPPLYLNTRIYSCILILNSLPYRWRGIYNEDTDLSLRALEDGWCTALFNSFLCKKIATMKMKGGNTDELYRGNGRLKMAQSLVEQHPRLTRVTWKFHRYQHHVDYRPFKRNILKRKPDATPAPDYGLVEESRKKA